MLYSEFTASDVQKILQEIFPLRRLVLSQFTFFNHIGVGKPTGETFKRNRRCYKLTDILPIACVLSLKEKGIPLKNVSDVPRLIQENSLSIFTSQSPIRLSGVGEKVHLDLNNPENLAIMELLENPTSTNVFWSFDVSAVALQILDITERLFGVTEKQRAFA
ncbi:MAG: hypothetical protein KBC84_01920 [Proteobacteria bacterium]|nr:hypothetical protein [Pseudomonadota bacterium]